MELVTHKKLKSGRLMPWGKGTVVSGARGMIYLSGNTATADDYDPTGKKGGGAIGDAVAQWRAILANIKSDLEELGSALEYRSRASKRILARLTQRHTVRAGAAERETVLVLASPLASPATVSPPRMPPIAGRLWSRSNPSALGFPGGLPFGSHLFAPLLRILAMHFFHCFGHVRVLFHNVFCH
jgi:hypothetical protein